MVCLLTAPAGPAHPTVRSTAEGESPPAGYLALPSCQCWSGEVLSASGDEV